MMCSIFGYALRDDRRAKNAPLTSDKCILNRDEALDLLDEIRAQLPVELSRAQELIRAKEDYVKPPSATSSA